MMFNIGAMARRILIAVAVVSFSATVSGAASAAVLQSPTATVPSVTTTAVSGVAQTTATLNGTATPNGAATDAFFEWGTTTAYGNTTAAQALGTATSAASVTADITGLTPSTTYYYRVVATNGAGTTNGEDVTFTTTAAALTETNTAASSVGQSTAPLNETATPTVTTITGSGVGRTTATSVRTAPASGAATTPTLTPTAPSGRPGPAATPHETATPPGIARLTPVPSVTVTAASSVTQPSAALDGTATANATTTAASGVSQATSPPGGAAPQNGAATTPTASSAAEPPTPVPIVTTTVVSGAAQPTVTPTATTTAPREVLQPAATPRETATPTGAAPPTIAPETAASGADQPTATPTETTITAGSVDGATSTLTGAAPPNSAATTPTVRTTASGAVPQRTATPDETAPPTGAAPPTIAPETATSAVGKSTESLNEASTPIGVAPPLTETTQTLAGPEFVPGQVLVQFRAGRTESERELARNAVGAGARAAVGGPDGGLELLTTALPVDEAIKNLQTLPEVEFAEPNWVVRHAATSNDPYYTNGSLWGMYGDGTSPANQFGSQAGELWARGFTGSSGVYVGVVDEGIDFNHPDLTNNIWTNPFDPVDGIDNDGNGKIDDIHGWDFFGNNNSIYDGGPTDLTTDAHGTHVSGTIGGKGGNGIGVAGVNWNVTLISGKFLGPSGGTTAAAVAAVDYFTDLKTRHGMNIVALNNSWGGGGYSLALHQAIIRAAKKDILFIAAAGNTASNNDAVEQYPASYATNVAAGSETAASYDSVIAVAAITSSGALSSFSSYGATSVDIGAPGSGIYSTTPQNRYSSYSGTSMATPHVTGAAAMYKAINPSVSANDIRNVLLAQGISTPSLVGKTVTGARLNVGGFEPIRATLSINDVSVTEGQSGTTNARFTVALSEASTGTVTVDYQTADGTATAANTTTAVANSAVITIPSLGTAAPYPSTITVSAGLGSVQKVTATLSGFSHTFPADVDVLLVGPGGQSVVLMSDVGSSIDATGLTFVFDDTGPALGTDTLASGTYKPTNIGSGDSWSSPAPAGPYGTALSVFNGLDPAGVWRLYVIDDFVFDSGSFSGGWSLSLTTPSQTADYTATSGTITYTPGTTVRLIDVAVNGDTAFELKETFVVNLSRASGASISDSQGVGTILNDDAITDPTLVAGQTTIKAAHIAELRLRIDAVRAARGLGAYSWSESLTAGSTALKAVHFAELRTALAEAYVAAGMTAPTYTAPSPATGLAVVATVISELRAAVTAIE